MTMVVIKLFRKQVLIYYLNNHSKNATKKKQKRYYLFNLPQMAILHQTTIKFLAKFCQFVDKYCAKAKTHQQTKSYRTKTSAKFINNKISLFTKQKNYMNILFYYLDKINATKSEHNIQQQTAILSDIFYLAIEATSCICLKCTIYMYENLKCIVCIYKLNLRHLVN